MTTGTAGNDTLISSALGADVVLGLEGDDSLSGAFATFFGNRFEGGPGNDTIIGAEGPDTLLGQDGDDSLSGGGGTDLLDGGDGNDRLRYGASTAGALAGYDILLGGAGDDTVEAVYAGVPAGFRADGGDGIDALLLDFTGLADAVQVSLSLLWTGGNGAFRIGTAPLGKLTNFETLVQVNGGLGNDTIYTGGVSSVVLGGAGDDRIMAGQDTASGIGWDDTLLGGTGNDIIYGYEGDDLLIGGAGIDKLYGGGGNDTIQIGFTPTDTPPTVPITVTGLGVVDAGAGDDEISLANAVANIQGGDDFDMLTLDFSRNHAVNLDFRALDTGAQGKYTIDGITGRVTGIESLTVFDSRSADLFRFSDMGVFLNSQGGADTIIGGAGSDQFFARFNRDGVSMRAGGGDDFLQGGAGADTIRGDEGNDAVNGYEGNDLVYGGEGDDALLGEMGNDTLYGEGGDDNLMGGDGADRLDGGDGNDTLVVNSHVGIYYPLPPTLLGGIDTAFGGDGDDHIIINEALARVDGGAGFDKLSISMFNTAITLDLRSAANGKLTENGVTTMVTGIESLKVFASDQDDVVFIGVATGWVESGGGKDTIVGGNGDDMIVGGQGADMLRGGAGADTFRFGYDDHEVGVQDRISDFSAAEGDRIDLSELDADLSTADLDDAFVLVGAFSHVAGQLVIKKSSGANWRVQGDMDGDGIADLDLLVTSSVALTAADFLL